MQRISVRSPGKNATYNFNISGNAETLRFPLLELRGLGQPLKTRPIALFLLHQTCWHNAVRQVMFSSHLPNQDSSIRLPDREA
uniref:Uncharacterized protein n=1 Tax=Pygocentrus nattereri TaxID=42514 RepID=A0AAR2KCG6_PYGNA